MRNAVAFGIGGGFGGCKMGRFNIDFCQCLPGTEKMREGSTPLEKRVRKQILYQSRKLQKFQTQGNGIPEQNSCLIRGEIISQTLSL